MATDLKNYLERVERRLAVIEKRINNLERVETIWAPAYDDLRVPVTSVKLGGTKDPEFAVFQDDGGGSQGVFLYWFDDTTEEEIYFTAQLPHGYKEGSTIEVHTHWVPEANGAAGQVVCWGLEYVWRNIGATYGPTAIIYGNEHYPADNPLVADRHYMTDIGDITGTGQTISSMLVCRLFRDAAGVGDTDDYGSDAGLLEVDFHVLMDAIGSRSETVK